MASKSPISGVGYDRSLLAAAPEVTKADKQEGYNPDLLEQGAPTRAPASKRALVSMSTNGNHNGSDESNGVRKTAGLAPVPSSGSKARSRKLTWIIIGIVLLVVIGVAVGVGVGVGTKKPNNASLNGIPNLGGSTGPVTGDSTTKTDGTGQSATNSGAGAASPFETTSAAAAAPGVTGGIPISTISKF